MKTYKPEHEIVLTTAIEQGATNAFAQLTLSQMMHESSDFTSRVYKNNNNPMGMKLPRKRKSPYIAGKGTQPPGNEGATPYARFNSLEDAVKDLFHWLRYNKIDFNKVSTVDQYVAALKAKSYFGNSAAGARIYTAGLLNGFRKLGAALQSASQQIGNAIIPGAGSMLPVIVLLVAVVAILLT